VWRRGKRRRRGGEHHAEESGDGPGADGRQVWHTVVGCGQQPEDGGAGSRAGEAGEEREKGVSGGGGPMGRPTGWGPAIYGEGV
jgi:hypothetical protein